MLATKKNMFGLIKWFLAKKFKFQTNVLYVRKEYSEKIKIFETKIWKFHS